jgi:membrane-bound lytic murein transglycosylase B
VRISITAIAIMLAAAFAAAPASAQTDPAFAAWLTELRAEAQQSGISKPTLDASFAGVAPIPRIIELDRKQPESTLTFEQYVKRIVSNARVTRGRARLQENSPLLQEVAAKFGVQPRFIVALWGIETNFGQNTGGFSVIAALATLAYDGRRSKYFRGELLEALRIVEQGHIRPENMKGSWAGAMGQSQFMPSSFVNYAYDYDGDGAKDIWTTSADVFASAANYLSGVGWNADITWGREVRLPAGFDPALADLKVVKRLPEWQALGVRRADGRDLPARDLKASVVFPGKTGGPAYIVYDNYRALLRWNRSLYFATAVGLLSDKIADR